MTCSDLEIPYTAAYAIAVMNPVIRFAYDFRQHTIRVKEMDCDTPLNPNAVTSNGLPQSTLGDN